MSCRFQFRLRTLLIGVTLLAVPCAFVGWKVKTVREREEFIRTRDCYMAPNPFDEKKGDPSVPWSLGLFALSRSMRFLLTVQPRSSAHGLCSQMR